MSFDKNQLLDVTFEDLTHEGLAVAKPEGMPIFVAGGLPGESGQIKVTKMQKTHGFGRLVKLTKVSSDRAEPPCPVYMQCGGCQLQHLSYEAQLGVKRKLVSDAFTRIGKLTDVAVHPVIGMDQPWRYRNKSQVPVGTQDGKLVTGFFMKRSHDIVAMDECMIQMEANDHAVQVVKDICQKYEVSAYDEVSRRGVLRHILVRYGKVTGELMVVLVVREKRIVNIDDIVTEIVKALPALKSLVLNVNRDHTNVILGKKNISLWGSDVIYDEISGVRFAISPHSFYQVNSVQTEVLYEKAVEYAGMTGAETVIDAYCGIGTISLLLAKKAKQVYGVEIVETAIADADRNANLNQIKNATFVLGAAEETMGKWVKEGIIADVVVLDPPRKGCDRRLLDAIIEMVPKRVVYVSCNPATLARDLRILADGGFKVQEAQPVDMFSMTGHVETVVLLQRS